MSLRTRLNKLEQQAALLPPDGKALLREAERLPNERPPVPASPSV